MCISLDQEKLLSVLAKSSRGTLIEPLGHIQLISLVRSAGPRFGRARDDGEMWVEALASKAVYRTDSLPTKPA